MPDEPKIYKQLVHDHSQLLEQEELRKNLTRTFIDDINGVIQCIFGNAELFKLKYAHKLNDEAANYLHKIEGNSEKLFDLLNTFRATVHPDKKSIDAASHDDLTDLSKTMDNIRRSHT